MLGTHGQKLCNNLDVYWMIETCEDGKNATCEYMDVVVCKIAEVGRMLISAAARRFTNAAVISNHRIP